MTETRRGNTGIWTFVLRTAEGKVLATSAWGRNHFFDEREWQALPLIESCNQPKTN